MDIIGEAGVAIRPDWDAFRGTAKVPGGVRPVKVPTVAESPIDEAFRRRVQADLRKMAQRAESEMPVTAETAAARAEVDRLLREIGAKAATIGTEVDREGLRASLAEAMDELGRQVDATVDLDVDQAQADTVVAAAAREAGRRSSAPIKVDIDRGALTGMINRTARLLGSLSTLAVPAALSTLGPVLVAIAGAAAPAVGTVGLLPGVLGLAATAMGTVKLATVGMGDAMDAVASGDAKKLAEALKELSPEAQEFVKAVAGAKPEFDEFRKGIQDIFFTDMGAGVTTLADSLLPRLGDSLGETAGLFNRTAREALAFAATDEAITSLNDVIYSSNGALDNLLGAATPLAAAFMDIAAVGADFFPSLTSGADLAAQSFADMIQNARETGQLHQFFSDALDTLGQLGQVALNVGQIITAVFSAGADTGGGLLESLETATARIRDMAQSVAGQEALSQFFEFSASAAGLLADAINVVLPLVGPLVGLFDTLAMSIGQGVVEVLGELVRAALPVVDALQPVAEVLGTALRDVLIDLAPVIGDVASVLGDVLVASLQALTPLIGPLAEVIGVMAEQFAAFLAENRDQLIEMITLLGTSLVEAITILLPVLPQLLDSFIQLAEAVIPVIPPLAELAAAVLPPLATALAFLLPYIIDFFTWIGELTLNIMLLLGPIKNMMNHFDELKETVGDAVEGLSTVVDAAFAGIEANLNFLGGLVSTVTNAMGLDFSGFGAGATGALSSFGSRASSIMSATMSALRAVVSSGIDAVVGFFRGLGGSINSALGGLPGQLVAAGRNLVEGLISGIRGMAAAAANAARDVVNRAIQAAWDTIKPGSPSKVGRAQGRNWVEGWLAELGDSRDIVAAAVRDVLSPVVTLDGVNVTAGVGAAVAAAAPRVDVNVTNNVYGSPGQSPAEIAEATTRAQDFSLATGLSPALRLVT